MSICAACARYVPHPQYKYIGYCEETGSVVVGSNPRCEKFSPMTEDLLRALMDSRGWVYCVDCRKAIFDLEEALDHMRSGDVLSSSFMFDEVAREEVSSAD